MDVYESDKRCPKRGTVFRFVGLAGTDASFLDDWRANLGRAVTQQLKLAMLMDGLLDLEGTPVDGGSP